MSDNPGNLVERMTEDCDREDCKLQFGLPDNINIWRCLTCLRRWEVYHPPLPRTTYDKHGNESRPVRRPPEVIEIDGVADRAVKS